MDATMPILDLLAKVLEVRVGLAVPLFEMQDPDSGATQLRDKKRPKSGHVQKPIPLGLSDKDLKPLSVTQIVHIKLILIGLSKDRSRKFKQHHQKLAYQSKVREISRYCSFLISSVPRPGSKLGGASVNHPLQKSGLCGNYS